MTELGLYGSEMSVVADALRTFFSARLDLRVPVACRLYEKGRFSLGRAAEWSGLDLEELKTELHRRGIPRLTETDPDAVEAMAKRAAEAIRKWRGAIAVGPGSTVEDVRQARRLRGSEAAGYGTRS